MLVDYQIAANVDMVLEDSLSFYFLKINNHKKSGDVAPLAFETNNIKNIIVNKRKLNLLKKLKHDLYQQAISSNKVKIYNKKEETQEQD